MAEFKPMVKMKTTEPSVELKLKKGGSVGKMNGGVMGALASAPAAKKTARGMAARNMVRRAAPMIPPPAMSEGGETPAMHAKEKKMLSNVEKKLTKHSDMPASKAHKGLKTGGVVNGQGGYKTGGVVKGQGGYKAGGHAKKNYATGGKVESGAPVAMPKKPASKPVRINELAGTFKRGGGVGKMGGTTC
jgi:hypothetical protein